MIVKMSFVTLAGPKTDFDRIVDTYLSKYEIQLENALSELNAAGNLLPFTEPNPYKELLSQCRSLASMADVEEPFTCPDSMSVKDAEGIISALNEKLTGLRDQIGDLTSEKERLNDDRAALVPFRSLKYNLREVLGMNYIRYRFGRVPRDMWNHFQMFIAPDLDTVFIDCYTDADYIWGVYFAPDSLIAQIDESFRALHFEIIALPDQYDGTPEDACEEIDRRIAAADEKIASLEEDIRKLADEHKEEVKSACARIEIASQNFDVRKMAACTKDTTVTFHVLCGWMAADDAQKLLDETESDPDVVCMIDNRVTPSRVPPTKLKNPRIFRPFELFIKMYGLPSYGEIDPTIFVALTYSLLFGAMFGDVGQGLLLLIGGFLIYKWRKIPLAAIISCAGLSSTVFGFLYGSVFGFENIIEGIWINPRTSTVNLPFVGDFNTVFVATILCGVFLILTSMVLNMANAIRAGKLSEFLIGPNSLTGFVFFAALIATAVLYMTGHPLPGTALMIVMFGVPLLLIALKAPILNAVRKRKKLFPESAGLYFTEAFFELFEMLLNYFSNTLSFLRVGAFAISHGAMMEVVLTLAGASEGGTPNMLVIILGNLLVCGMEGLIVGIQGLRLEYYELFGRFYSGTGKEFKPYGAGRSRKS